MTKAVISWNWNEINVVIMHKRVTKQFGFSDWLYADKQAMPIELTQR